MGGCNALCEGRAGVHMGLYRHTGRAPAPGEGQEGPYRGTHEALQVHREGTCSRGGARRPHEDTGQLSLQAAGAEDLYGARGGGGRDIESIKAQMISSRFSKMNRGDS